MQSIGLAQSSQEEVRDSANLAWQEFAQQSTKMDTYESVLRDATHNYEATHAAERNAASTRDAAVKAIETARKESLALKYAIDETRHVSRVGEDGTDAIVLKPVIHALDAAMYAIESAKQIGRAHV